MNPNLQEQQTIIRYEQQTGEHGFGAVVTLCIILLTFCLIFLINLWIFSHRSEVPPVKPPTKVTVQPKPQPQPKTETPTQTPQQPSTMTPEPFYTGNPILMRINNFRASLGLHKLYEDRFLDGSAATKCKDMVDNHYFAHTSPSGTRGVDLINTYYYRGEILGRQYTGDELERQWENSPEHREVIVNTVYSHFGAAQCVNEVGLTLTVVHFGGQQ